MGFLFFGAVCYFVGFFDSCCGCFYYTYIARLFFGMFFILRFFIFFGFFLILIFYFWLFFGSFLHVFISSELVLLNLLIFSGFFLFFDYNDIVKKGRATKFGLLHIVALNL